MIILCKCRSKNVNTDRTYLRETDESTLVRSEEQSAIEIDFFVPLRPVKKNIRRVSILNN